MAPRTLLVVILSCAATLAGCGGTDKPSGQCSTDPGQGQVSKIMVSQGGGAPQADSSVVCVSAANSYLMTQSLGFGTLGNFSLSGPMDGTPGSCDDNVVVFLYDDPPDAAGYPVGGQWRAGGNTKNGTSCSFSANHQGKQLLGSFSGHLWRRKTAYNATDEYLDLSFDYSVTYAPPD